LIAHHLIDAGLDTVVLDKRDVAWGSTSATTGLIQYEIDPPLRELVGLVGKDHAVRSYRAALEAIAKLEAIAMQVGTECGFRRRQSVQLASRKEDVAGFRRAWGALPRLEAIARQGGRECVFRRRQSVQRASRKEDVAGLRDEHAL